MTYGANQSQSEVNYRRELFNALRSYGVSSQDAIYISGHPNALKLQGADVAFLAVQALNPDRQIMLTDAVTFLANAPGVSTEVMGGLKAGEVNPYNKEERLYQYNKRFNAYQANLSTKTPYTVEDAIADFEDAKFVAVEKATEAQKAAGKTYTQADVQAQVDSKNATEVKGTAQGNAELLNAKRIADTNAVALYNQKLADYTAKVNRLGPSGWTIQGSKAGLFVEALQKEYDDLMVEYNKLNTQLKTSAGTQPVDEEKQWLDQELQNLQRMDELLNPTSDTLKGIAAITEQRKASGQPIQVEVKANEYLQTQLNKIQMEDEKRAAAMAEQERQQRYGSYQSTGGQLAYDMWKTFGSPNTGDVLKENQTAGDVFATNLPREKEGLGVIPQTYFKNRYSDIFAEFQKTEPEPTPEETPEQALRRQMTKNERWGKFLKKYSWLQKYSGTAPAARGEYSGQVSPRVKSLNY